MAGSPGWPARSRRQDADLPALNVPQTKPTDNTGGDNTITAAAAGVGRYWKSFEYNLADLTDADILTDWTIGHKFKIFDFEIHVIVPSTTDSDASTVSLDIGTTAVTGASIALTSSNTSTKGAIVTTSTALANNTGTASDTLTIKAASTTAFAEGRISVAVGIQNMDTADLFAKMLDLLDDAGVTN